MDAFICVKIHSTALVRSPAWNLSRFDGRHSCVSGWRRSRGRRTAETLRLLQDEDAVPEPRTQKQSPFSGIATSESVQNVSKYAEVLLQKNKALQKWSEKSLERENPGAGTTLLEDVAHDATNEETSALSAEESKFAPRGKRGRRPHREQRPAGYWNADNVVREVLEFVRSRPNSGNGPQYMPTSNELREAKRSDLVRAIIVHGGYAKVAERCGLQPHRRSFGYWRKDFKNLEREIWSFIRERDGPEAVPREFRGDSSTRSRRKSTADASASQATPNEPTTRPRMPTYNELVAAKKRILAYAIAENGGFLEVARRMNLQLSSDETPWRDRDALVAELLRLFPDLMGKQKRFPRQQDLVRLGRYDLDWAIHRWHGGYTRLAAELGYLRSRLPCKPRNFWSDERNLENELRALLQANNMGWRMPNRKELEALDRHDLIYAIRKFGGFLTVATKLGLSRDALTHTRPRGYWSDFENLRTELQAFVQENGYPGIMPRLEQLRMYNREDLINAIHRHGGAANVARRLHLFWYGPKTFWRKFENLGQRLRAFLHKSRFSHDKMPTQQELISAGRVDVAYGVHLHGGVYEVARRLRLQVLDPPRAPFYWNDIQNVETELIAFVNSAVHAAWIQNGVMPTSMTIVRSGRRDLAAAIRRHGGWDAFARRLNLRPAAPKRPKGYWNTLRNVEAELLLYVQQREQVIAEFVRNYAADFVRRPGDDEDDPDAAGKIAYSDVSEILAGNVGNKRCRTVVGAIRNGAYVPVMPTAEELRLDGRADLVFACERIHGGLATVARGLGWPLLAERLPPESLKKDRNVLVQALMTMWIPIYGTAGEMPTEADLLRTGGIDIHEAIVCHGGYIEVARSLNLRHPEDPEWTDWSAKRFSKQRMSRPLQPRSKKGSKSSPETSVDSADEV